MHNYTTLPFQVAQHSLDLINQRQKIYLYQLTNESINCDQQRRSYKTGSLYVASKIEDILGTSKESLPEAIVCLGLTIYHSVDNRCYLQ